MSWCSGGGGEGGSGGGNGADGGYTESLEAFGTNVKLAV